MTKIVDISAVSPDCVFMLDSAGRMFVAERLDGEWRNVQLPDTAAPDVPRAIEDAVVSEKLGRSPITDLKLSNRVLTCLRVEDIVTVGRLLECTKKDILRTPNMGSRSLKEIVDALSARGLRLSLITNTLEWAGERTNLRRSRRSYLPQ